jgi:nitroreductase
MKEKIIDAFNFRHACKEFDAEKKIKDEDFNFILETARLSPSSFGLEPWRFLVVQNPELREKLREFTWGGQKQIPTASHLIVMLARKGFFMKYDSEYVRDFRKNVQKLSDDVIKVKNSFYEKFQKSDFNLLDNERSMFEWACRQSYIALANMMTAAAMIGIDSCPLEGFVADKIQTVMKKHFGIDSEKFGVSCMVTFGYRKKEPRSKTRQTLDKIIEWYN